MTVRLLCDDAAAMLIAILSDIHANREAYEAVLTAAAHAGADRLVILGDIVGYGGDPLWCVEKTRALAEAGAVVLRGNHDQAVGEAAPQMHAAALVAMVWTRRQLRDDEQHFLMTLPMAVTEEDRLYVHADASAPTAWNYVTDRDDASAHFAGTSARVSFVGHVHRPALYSLGTATKKVTRFVPVTPEPIPLLPQRRWLAVACAVGQPRDGNPLAGFCLYDTQSGALSFRRTAYDIDGAAAKIRAAGLPDLLAARLSGGY